MDFVNFAALSCSLSSPTLQLHAPTPSSKPAPGCCINSPAASSIPKQTSLLLPLAPCRLVEQYFELGPAPFHYITAPGSQALPISHSVTDAQLAHATLRGLQLSPQLRRRWRWPSALRLLQHAETDVRYCAVQCTALAFGLGDAGTEALARRVLSEQEQLDCTLRWQGEQALAAAARAAALLPPAGGSSSQGAATERDAAGGSGGSQDSTGSRKRKFGSMGAGAEAGIEATLGPIPGYVEVGGLELPIMGPQGGSSAAGSSAAGARPQTHPLVHTPSMDRNLQSLALGLCTGAPVLLEGPPGCGKSALVEHVAEVTGAAEGLVRIHLDDQMDSKSLMGAYVCTARPGEFVWQPGPLTQAVRGGRWVLVEDINLAPPEVLAALVPLLEGRALHIAARAEVVSAAPGFQLIATITSTPGGGGHSGGSAGAYGSSAGVRDLLGGLFHHVAVEPPSVPEQLAILGRLFPALAPLLPHAMATLALFQAAYGQAAGARTQQQAQQAQQEGEGVAEAVAAALAAGGVRPGELGLSVGRHFSLRDLAKWCSRMATVSDAATVAMQLLSGRMPAVCYGGVSC